MKCTLLNIGDELLIGQTLNTNAQWLSQRIDEIGVNVIHHVVLSDEKQDIVSSLNHALQTSDIVLITGGLGPTSDDITKEVLCEYFGGKLIFNEEAFANIERIFALRKRLINEATRQVAFLPDICKVIPNKNGTAAGMLFTTKDNKTVVSMPGVPYEMYAMIMDDIIPYLKENYQLPYILHCNILTAGVGETQLADRLTEFEMHKDKRIKLAYLPSVGKVRLRLTIRGESKEQLQSILEVAKQEVISSIGKYVYGFDNDLLENKTGELLLERGLTVGTAESCTGGYIAHLITSVAGSSRYFKGSIVSYSNEIKSSLLQVRETTLQTHGAVSEQTVSEMLDGTLAQLNVDVAIAVSGVAGPDGGTAEKPVGTVFVGVGSKERKVIKKLSLTNNRERNIQLSAIGALILLRKFILNPINS